jgi:manganese/iron transport system permease protein
MNALLDPFTYEFMQRAFVAALLVGALCSAIGTYVVLRKLSFIGDGIAHASFAGIVVAYLRGANFILGAGVVAVLTALGIGYVNRRSRLSLDTTIGVLFTGAFALGIFLMSISKSYSIDLQDFLFGNILGVTRDDLVLSVVLALVVFGAIAWLYRDLAFTSFDPTVAQAAGLRVERVENVLLVLLAVTIVISIQSVGIILVAALLVTPAAAAAQLTRRLPRMLALATGLGVFCTVGGLYASYYLHAASGATMVLLATLLFFLALGYKRFIRGTVQHT